MPKYEFTVDCRDCGANVHVMEAEISENGLFCSAIQKDQPTGWIAGKLMSIAKIPRNKNGHYYTVCPECGCEIDMGRTDDMHAIELKAANT
jgi:endogenous inhibitor of DNA gyrase (YacG/DUF329 family)